MLDRLLADSILVVIFLDSLTYKSIEEIEYRPNIFSAIYPSTSSSNVSTLPKLSATLTYLLIVFLTPLPSKNLIKVLSK